VVWWKPWRAKHVSAARSTCSRRAANVSGFTFGSAFLAVPLAGQNHRQSRHDINSDATIGNDLKRLDDRHLLIIKNKRSFCQTLEATMLDFGKLLLHPASTGPAAAPLPVGRSE
jgi:hypothetical protein